jgi:general secretion pathway protein C
VPETENLPKTNLRLILRGALAADGEFPGSALIEHPDGETEVYMVGDSLPGDARLRTVLSNRVILERNGTLESLYFPETENRNGVELISNSQSQPVSPERQAQKEEIRRRLEQTRQRLQENN